MNRNPLSYGSLKSVIQYMNPNVRFQIKATCRTLRVTEKLIPLKIQNLTLDPENLSISVDGIDYKLGMITRFYKPDGTLDRVGKRNKVVDYDRYGFKDRPADMTPGDLMVRDMEVRNYDAVRQQEDNQLIGLEQKLKNLSEVRVEIQKLPKTPEVVMGFGLIDRQVKELREQMLPYQLRRDNGQPQLTNYLQLTIGRYKCSKKIEYVEYNRKLGEAMKYLTSKILGGRRSPIFVDRFDIRTFGCFRLPQNLKLEVKTLRFLSEGIPRRLAVLDAFETILDKKCISLKEIVMKRVYQLNHQLVKSAEKLVIYGKYIKPWAIGTTAFASQRVDINMYQSYYYSGYVIALVKKWRERGREIGTHYSFGIETKWEVQKEFDIVKKEPDANIGEMEETRLTPFPECVTIPLNEHSEINIHAEEVKQEYFKFAVHVKVQPI